MNKSRITVRDKLETMWYFHRDIVVQFLVADAIIGILLSLVTGESVAMLPAYAVPCFSVANYVIANRRYKAVQFELPLGMFFAFGFATFLALANSLTMTVDHARASFGGWISLLFLVLFGILTAGIGFATYLLWSEDEMDARVSLHQFRARR
ncbi:MAG: hypothetical protein JST12_07395 [Armatimonadetes bacterium]|nr:hypothetical protein [Armatimonadota bacterium]MBS1701468.1 hypothetical protein [Armatimonadota bacterium]MBS1725480.1 hypothetical protein [Armatimonadota bacterium]